MKTTIAYLGSADCSLDLTRSCLAHEFAHGHAWDLGKGFWQEWSEQFPRLALVEWNNKQYARSLGILDPYALFDYNVHESSPLPVPSRQGRLVSRGKIPIYNYSFAQPKSIEHILKAFDELPSSLKKTAAAIGIYPVESYCASMGRIRHAPMEDSDFKRITEDIAVHTEYFLDMFYNPASNKENFEFLVSSPLLQKRLDMLEQHGFLDGIHAKRIRRVAGVEKETTSVLDFSRIWLLNYL